MAFESLQSELGLLMTRIQNEPEIGTARAVSCHATEAQRDQMGCVLNNGAALSLELRERALRKAGPRLNLSSSACNAAKSPVRWIVLHGLAGQTPHSATPC